MEDNIILQNSINSIQKRDRIQKYLNIFLILVLITIVVLIFIHKFYFKENTYSILNNDIVNSNEIVKLDEKGTEEIKGETKYYIEYSNDKMKNRIFVNKGVYDNAIVGNETVVNVKDIYDKKGNILKEELLFNIDS